MSKFLEKIQKKPEWQRRRILIASATILTTLIVFLWISILYARYLSSSSERKAAQRETVSPFEVFFKDLGERAETLKSGYKSVTDIVSEVSKKVNQENFLISSSSENVFYATTSSISSPLEEENP